MMPAKRDRYRHYKLTVQQVCDMLVETGGLVRPAARKLGVDKETVYGVLRRSPKARRVREEARLQLIDQAEESIAELVRQKNLIASMFVLKCLGKERGWIDHPTPVQAFNVNFIDAFVQARERALERRAQQQALQGPEVIDVTPAPEE